MEISRFNILGTLSFILVMSLFYSCDEKNQYNPEIKLTSNSYYRNPELIFYFNNLCWKDELSRVDKNNILAIIDSSQNKYRRDKIIDILTPSLIHRFDITTERDTLNYWERSKEYFDETKDMSENEYDNYLLRKIEPSRLVKNLKHGITHYYYAGDLLLNVLVVRQSRLLRAGLEPYIKLDNSLLNKSQECILTYSKFEDSIAVNKLLKRALVFSKNQEIYNGAIDAALSSYGREATLKSFKTLLNKEALNNHTEIGKTILLRHLINKAKIDLTKEELNSLVNYLNQKMIYEGVLKGQLREISFLTHFITHRELDECRRSIGLTYELN